MIKGFLLALAGFVVGLVTAAMFLSGPKSGDATLSALPAPYYTVLWENDDVRIVEHRLEAGDSEPMHSHPRMFAYFLEDATVRINVTDTGVIEESLVKGTTAEVGPWTHEIENIGNTPLHSLIVELKTTTLRSLRSRRTGF